MNRVIRFFVPIAILLLVTAFVAFSQQASFQVPIFINGVGATDTSTIYVGINGDGPGGTILDNTYAPDLDTAYGEYGNWVEMLAPPPPPTVNWWITLIDIPSRTGDAAVIGATGMFPYDFRGFTAPGQIDSFAIKITGNNVANGELTLTWPATIGNLVYTPVLKKKLGPNWNIVVADMTTQTSYTDPNLAYASTFNFLLIFTPKVVFPGPSFIVNPTSLTFGMVSVGGSASLPITVSNDGDVNPLNISSIVTPPDYSISPTSASVGPHSSQVFTVTFSPSSGGPIAGDIVFTHNALGSPSSIPVSGEGRTQGGTLEFPQPSITVLDNSILAGGFYQNIIRLNDYSGVPLQAVQFTLVSRGKVIMHPLAKAPAIASWVMSTNVRRGPQQPDGSSIDTIHVVLYGMPSTVLTPGSYDLVTFGYDVVNISTDNDETSFGLFNILGSTSLAGNADLNTDAEQVVTINNRTYWGDVNEDDNVDVLDLLLVVDHITGKQLLTGGALTRADIAPWPDGQPNPSSDGIVDVRDLVQLQEVILTGEYPSGLPLLSITSAAVGSLAKTNAVVRIKFYVEKETVSLEIENSVSIRGLQAEINNIGDAYTNIKDASIDGVVSNLSDSVLSIVVKLSELLPPGKHFIGQIPVTLDIPENVEILSLLIAGSDIQKLTNVTAEIIPSGVTDVSSENQDLFPVNFALGQNYPNPFNPETHVNISVPKSSDVRVTIYNLLGQEVKILFAGKMERGVHPLRWDGKDQSGKAVATGTYIYRMQAGSFVETKKMLLMK